MIQHPAFPLLKTLFADIPLAASEFRGAVTLAVPKEHILPICQFLKNEPTLQYVYLAELHGVDYLNYPGAQHRFSVDYCLTSLHLNNRLWLKVFLNPQKPTGPGSAAKDPQDHDPGLILDSVTPVWPGAEWLERETYDMFGIKFNNHPDLRRILTWTAFDSHPLQKDYPLQGVGERQNYQYVGRDSA